MSVTGERVDDTHCLVIAILLYPHCSPLGPTAIVLEKRHIRPPPPANSRALLALFRGNPICYNYAGLRVSNRHTNRSPPRFQSAKLDFE